MQICTTPLEENRKKRNVKQTYEYVVCFHAAASSFCEHARFDDPLSIKLSGDSEEGRKGDTPPADSDMVKLKGFDVPRSGDDRGLEVYSAKALNSRPWGSCSDNLVGQSCFEFWVCCGPFFTALDLSISTSTFGSKNSKFL